MFVKDGRRQPSQERSKRRHAQILDAAAALFEERGFEGATMETIAERAETSIGSVYQFFRNKQEIIDALAVSYRDNVRAFFFSLMTEENLAKPWRELLAFFIESLWKFHHSQPAFRAVWVSMRLTKELIDEGEAVNAEIASLAEGIFQVKLSMPKKKRAAVAHMMVEVMSASLITGARHPDRGEAILTETKELRERYLAPFEDPRLR